MNHCCITIATLDLIDGSQLIVKQCPWTLHCDFFGDREPGIVVIPWTLVMAKTTPSVCFVFKPSSAVYINVYDPPTHIYGPSLKHVYFGTSRVCPWQVTDISRDNDVLTLTTPQKTFTYKLIDRDHESVSAVICRSLTETEQ